MDTEQPAQANLPALETLARFSWQHAAQCCDPAHDCLLIHKTWSTLRWLLEDGRRPAGSRFLVERIEAMARRGGSGILISGGADSGLLEIIGAACTTLKLFPRVIFVDRCATPCQQNQMLGDHLPFAVKAIQSDILEFDEGTYDLVVAHNFLQYFSAGDQTRVVQRWASLLAPGAELAVVQNLVTDPGIQFTERNTRPDRLAYRRLAESARQAGFTDADIEQLGALARELWSIERIRAVHREQLLKDLLSSGLTLNCCQPVADGADNKNGPRGNYRRVRYQVCARMRSNSV